MSAYGPLAGWYDALTGDVPYGDFLAYYEKIFADSGEKVETVLDLACGTGTMTCLLARRGYETIGVDASADMLAMAMDKAAELPEGCERPLLLCQELAELDLYGTVDAAVCCLDGVNYLLPEELPEVFRRLRLFVRPGGLVVFDIHSPQRLRSLDGQVFTDETDELLCLWRADFDEEENALVYGMDLFTLEPDGRYCREREEHVEFAHEPQLLTKLLQHAGFARVQISDQGPQGELGRLFITAR